MDKYLKIELENFELKLLCGSVINPDTGCWLWIGDKNNGGYGFTEFNYHRIGVHRASAHFYLGLDLSDKTIQVNHKNICPNKNCWNPNHLYIGTKSQNTIDAIQSGKIIGGKIQSLKTHCPYGHEYTQTPTQRICKTCRAEQSKKSYENKKKIMQSIIRELNSDCK